MHVSPPASPIVPAPSGPPAVSPRWSAAAWVELLGRHWRVWLALGIGLAFLAGAARPLADPDLGLHLRIGEWIVVNGRLPRIEPFAWTRAGAPFYAYSWLAEIAFFETLEHGGPLALHALEGTAVAAAALAMAWYARVSRLSALATVLIVVLHVLAMLTLVIALRPQAVLGIAMPLCWAATTRLASAAPGARAPRTPYLVLWASAAFAANAHLLAPVCLASLALVVPGRGVPLRTTLLAAAALVIGLLSTPYAFDWVAIVRLNFAPNAMFRFPSPIIEHQPGVHYVAHAQDFATIAAIGLCLLPWALPRPARRRALETLALGALWLVGLLAFAAAVRGLLLWWLVAIPLLATALDRLPDLSKSLPGRAIRALPFAALAALVFQGWRATVVMRRWEGDTVRRTLAGGWALAAMQIADTLDHLAPNGSGHLLTTFNYGNALLWRLPRYSASLDGRTIFPDSAAKIEGWVLGPDLGDSIPTVIGSSDVAVLPYTHTLTHMLAKKPEWRRVANARPVVGGRVVDSASLWARDTWLAKHGIAWPRAAPATVPAR